ncbi:MAG: hypothetical protein HY739_10845 [Desulfobacterales bacterium]|nr:hypothetical protein [Desulfobacterales bacterium]
MFEWALNNAFMFTIFGYGAPKTDVKAIEFMKKTWGQPEQRALEEVEIIDTKTESELMQAWGVFIHSHHYMVCDNFYDSWIGNHPRRTGEAYINQFRRGRFIKDNKLPKELDFDELWKWLLPLKETELSNY